jgi:hypothetical protein
MSNRYPSCGHEHSDDSWIGTLVAFMWIFAQVSIYLHQAKSTPLFVRLATEDIRLTMLLGCLVGAFIWFHWLKR